MSDKGQLPELQALVYRSTSTRSPARQRDRTFLYFTFLCPPCVQNCLDLSADPSVPDPHYFCVCSWKNSLVRSQRPQDARRVTAGPMPRDGPIYQAGSLKVQADWSPALERSLFISCVKEAKFIFNSDLMLQLMKLTLLMFRSFFFIPALYMDDLHMFVCNGQFTFCPWQTKWKVEHRTHPSFAPLSS